MLKMARIGILAALAALILAFGLTNAEAQRGQAGQNGQAPGQRQGGMQRGAFTPDRMWEFTGPRIKENLGVSDDEWSVIEPLVKDVSTKQMATRMRGMGGMGGMRGGARRPGGPGAEADDNTPKEIKELRDVLDNENATSAEIKTKLAAYRALVKKQQDELKAAQEKLVKVLTPRQEAALVLSGMLE